jgi:hypothetical protein
VTLTPTQLKRLRKDELLQVALTTREKLTETEKLLLTAAFFGGTLGFLVGLGF